MLNTEIAIALGLTDFMISNPMIGLIMQKCMQKTYVVFIGGGENDPTRSFKCMSPPTTVPHTTNDLWCDPTGARPSTCEADTIYSYEALGLILASF